MLLIVEPLSFVVGTVGMGVGARSFSLVVDPLTLIDVTVSMHKLALAVGFIILPHSFVTRTIWPQLCSISVAHAVEPLSCVGRSILESVWALCDTAILIDFFSFSRSQIGVPFAEHAASLAVIDLLAYSIEKLADKKSNLRNLLHSTIQSH